ncbi:hypothetical protein N7471_009297 [Penicillium samsonianum]|uniref:uncharacterized protein n=1 Tax=Penicillium samsonianum TaxID=1882272 RepID=UPI002549A476|nr:uncharacterized protein N7471_009297 [Penicillium samsonianum]KAJ6128080.1 hypothetical protein N7471_009297 [Penicillium samsonianum]
MEPTTAKKRARVDEADDQNDYPPRYRPPPFCQHCGARSHPGTCRFPCPRCDKRHIGVCTAFCRKCADIGHSWRHCRLFVPDQIWRKHRHGTHTTIENVNITLPVIKPASVLTPTSLNAAILSQLDVALGRLHRKAGLPMHARVMMNNVNITTSILAPERASPLAPDTSLLERVKPIPTGPGSNIPNNRPTTMKPTFAQSSFARSAFSQPMFSQPVFGQPAFSQPTFIQNNSVEMTPTYSRSFADLKC